MKKTLLFDENKELVALAYSGLDDETLSFYTEIILEAHKIKNSFKIEILPINSLKIVILIKILDENILKNRYDSKKNNLNHIQNSFNYRQLYKTDVIDAIIRPKGKEETIRPFTKKVFYYSLDTTTETEVKSKND